MASREEFERAGVWLFRHRSYLPLLLLALIVPALAQHERPAAHGAQHVPWEILCFSISLTGLAIRAAVQAYAPTGTSGRTTDKPAADALNTSGLYSVVRHPLYVGNSLMVLGVTLFPGVWWCPVIGALCLALYYERIMFAEEEFLRRRFGDAWMAWSARTPMFWPDLRRWRSPSGTCSTRRILRREYSALFGLAAAFAVMDAVGNFFLHGRLVIDPLWIGVFCGSAGVYIVLRTVKRSTSLLSETGR